MAAITWLDKIDGFDLGDPQKNVNAADMNQIKTVVNTNNTEKAPIDSPTFTTLITTPLVKITGGSPGVGKVLTSDADGDGTWETPTSFVDSEVPSGDIDGVNVTYTLANTPIAGSVKVYWNGQKMRVGVGYLISGTTLSMTLPPETGDILEVDYRK